MIHLLAGVALFATTTIAQYAICGFDYRGCFNVDARSFGVTAGLPAYDPEDCQEACKGYPIAGLFYDACRCASNIPIVRQLDESACGFACQNTPGHGACGHLYSDQIANLYLANGDCAISASAATFDGPATTLTLYPQPVTPPFIPEESPATTTCTEEHAAPSGGALSPSPAIAPIGGSPDPACPGGPNCLAESTGIDGWPEPTGNPSDPNDVPETLPSGDGAGNAPGESSGNPPGDDGSGHPPGGHGDGNPSGGTAPIGPGNPLNPGGNDLPGSPDNQARPTRGSIPSTVAIAGTECTRPNGLLVSVWAGLAFEVLVCFAIFL